MKALAPKHPEWKTKQPFKGILAHDMKAVAAAGDKALDEATARGWTVVDMKRDWKKIYPFE